MLNINDSLNNTLKMRKKWRLNSLKENKKEIIFYSILVVILITISILNNVFWKIGKEEKTITNTQEIEQTQQLEVNNITYNVPFEEKWLD